MKMSPYVVGLVVVVVALALLAAGVGRRRDGQLVAAQASLQLALRDVARQKSLADLLTDRAHAAEVERDSALAAVRVAERSTIRTRTKYATAREAAPDTCAAVVQAADSALAAADRTAELLRVALRDTRTVSDSYKAALDSLRPAYERLGAAASAVDRVARPGLLERLTPRAGVGVAAGVDPFTHRPAAVIGVTLGWSF